jgi:hypothetical protein
MDLDFWRENGYVVIPGVVPKDYLEATVSAIWEFLEIDPGDEAQWYKHKPSTRIHRSSPISAAGMVEFYHHQALWNNRQYPRIYQAFAEIWDDEKLWVSLDRANMKPPARPDRPDWCHEGMIHWDTDTTKAKIPFGVQGVLYLTDTAENQGGLQCVPGFHRIFKDWVRTQPPDRDPRHPDLAGLKVKSIAGKAGDLVIWHRLLAHGNGHNRSDRPRLAQYISMSPVPDNAEEVRDARIGAWRERRPNPGWPGDPRNREQSTQRPARLTPLGRKLLGIDAWV